VGQDMRMRRLNPSSVRTRRATHDCPLSRVKASDAAALLDVRSCTHIASGSSSSGSSSESSLDVEKREEEELWALCSTLSVKQPLRLLSVTSVKLTEVLTS